MVLSLRISTEEQAGKTKLKKSLVSKKTGKKRQKKSRCTGAELDLTCFFDPLFHTQIPPNPA